VASLIVERVLVPAEGTHRAIAERAFGLVGERANAVRRFHNSVSGLLYGSIRAVTSVASATIGVAAAAVAGSHPYQPVTSTRRGSAAVSAINGLWGDELSRRGNDLQIEMAFRDRAGAPIAISEVSLKETFPDATARLAVFIHGLVETERCWGDDDSLGESLASVGGFSELRLRYNSGLPIADNGKALAALLEEVSSAWPVEIEEIVLVGHSMGGLVARSAAHAGAALPWINTLAHIVTIGTPHMGAPLEKATHALTRALRLLPESRPIAAFLDDRSRGIKDLRYGTLVTTGLDGVGGETSGAVRIPAHTRHHFVAGTVTDDPSHPMGFLIGDLVVRTASGTGRGRNRVVAPTNAEVFGGRNHLSLTTDPEVHRLVAMWLSG